MSTDSRLLVRRSEAMEILGVGWRVFRQLIEAKKVTPRRWHGRGRAYFARAELEALADRRANVLFDSHAGRRSKEQ